MDVGKEKITEPARKEYIIQNPIYWHLTNKKKVLFQDITEEIREQETKKSQRSQNWSQKEQL